jgi:hypothetical protein
MDVGVRYVFARSAADLWNVSAGRREEIVGGARLPNDRKIVAEEVGVILPFVSDADVLAEPFP